MADEKPAGVKSTVTGWIKAGITSVVGLLSGAFIMYLTPVVNQAIKPAKPVANFATQVTGLTASFNNRSTGGAKGWWDFGDGSALEPFDPKIEIVKHVYAKPATYSAKLTLTNLLGEESERVAPVVIDADSVPKPEIAAFQLIPITPGDRAPAVFKLIGQVKNANFCVLSYGDHRPMEILDAATQDRYVTFEEMGAYTVRLAAVNGKQLLEKSQTIFIGANDTSNPMAKLQVIHQAVKVDRLARDWPVRCDWPEGCSDSSTPIRKERLAYPGYSIVSAELANKDDPTTPVRNLKVEVAPDKSKVVLTGELAKSSGLHWLAHVKAVMERRAAPQTINHGDVAMAVDLNGTMKIPLQPLGDGYESVSRKVTLQLWDGDRMAWEGSKNVTNAKVMFNKQVCNVTVIFPPNDSVLLKIETPTNAPKASVPPGPITQPQTSTTPIGPVLRPASFERPFGQFRPKGN